MTALIPMLLKAAAPAVLDAFITEKAKTKVKAAAKRRKATDLELHNAESMDLPKAFRWRGAAWLGLALALWPQVAPHLGLEPSSDALRLYLEGASVGLGIVMAVVGWARQVWRRVSGA